MNLTASVLAGDRLAIARLMTQVENATKEGLAELEGLFQYTGKAHIIGVTGAPGVGKSSLVNHLARYFRHPSQEKAPCTVGVIAVDPSSPFTGGAILGDRVRMRDLAGDPGVFIRSMATRGSLGGLANTTAGLIQILDAAGYQLIFVETVGAGQTEVDIARLAHTTLVVESPGLGDDIQAIKAGILEIADILVLNKADHPGAEIAESALRNALQFAPVTQHNSYHHGEKPKNQKKIEISVNEISWTIPILRTVASDGKGIAEVAAQIECHRDYLITTGEWTKRDQIRLQSELESLLQSSLMQRWRNSVSETSYQEVLNQLINREISTTQAVNLLIDGGFSQ
ncbi:MAG: methylmalonyl Co-A mutase-associated GTPase MeaB [Chloroflexi bacterium]|nr:methylmalonyl Co-A mutase-associated GTPase MeaB [Chloroflexota bacterium]